jgi:hypothetical protein
MPHLSRLNSLALTIALVIGSPLALAAGQSPARQPLPLVPAPRHRCRWKSCAHLPRSWTASKPRMLSR